MYTCKYKYIYITFTYDGYQVGHFQKNFLGKRLQYRNTTENMYIILRGFLVASLHYSMKNLSVHDPNFAIRLCCARKFLRQ